MPEGLLVRPVERSRRHRRDRGSPARPRSCRRRPRRRGLDSSVECGVGDVRRPSEGRVRPGGQDAPDQALALEGAKHPPSHAGVAQRELLLYGLRLSPSTWEYSGIDKYYNSNSVISVFSVISVVNVTSVISFNSVISVTSVKSVNCVECNSC